MERIFYNGKFYQGRDMFKQAMFVKDGIIEKIGTNEEILSLNKNCELMDLQGRTVIPGFNDSHLHLEGVGYRLSNLNLYGLQSIDEVIENAKKYIIDNKIDDVLLGNGWNQDYFVGEKRLLNRHDLDQISRDIPIVFTRVCGHILVANTKALEILEISQGYIGDIIGLLKKAAIYAIETGSEKISLKEIKECNYNSMANVNKIINLQDI